MFDFAFLEAFLRKMSKFKTWEQTLGYVFGSGIEEFEEGHFPTEFDISRRLIALVDKERKKVRFSPDAAISTLAKELVSFWEIHSSLPTKPVKAIGKKYTQVDKKLYKRQCSVIGQNFNF